MGLLGEDVFAEGEPKEEDDGYSLSNARGYDVSHSWGYPEQYEPNDLLLKPVGYEYPSSLLGYEDDQDEEGRLAEPEKPRKGFGPPGYYESFIPIWGSGRAALDDFRNGNYGWAAANTLMTLADLTMFGSFLRVAKVGVRFIGPHAWKIPYYLEKKENKLGMRKWLGKAGYLKPYQHGHHWAVPQAGWGQYVPDAIKNQAWNILPMPNDNIHMALHQGYRIPETGEKIKFGKWGKFRHGTPLWFKAQLFSTPFHSAEAGRIEGRWNWNEDVKDGSATLQVPGTGIPARRDTGGLLPR